MCLARRFGIGQVHPAAHAGRFRAAHRGADFPRWRGYHRHAALRAADQHDVPVLRLVPHMTVAQNIAFGLQQDKIPKAEVDARVAEMLKLVQMSQYAKRKPHQLSGGQRQRVALARSWPSGRSCCCSTNRWEPWTRSCARKCSLSWWRSSSGSV
ncbi:ATP-binding cassette domain-containing protein [Pseudomonas sp. NA13]